MVPTFLKDHFQLNDFTPFHDEIRKVSADFLVGKYMTALPAGAGRARREFVAGPVSRGGQGGQFGFYYTLTRLTRRNCPTNTLLRPFLDAQLPDGVGMTVRRADEGWYFPGVSTPAAGGRAISRSAD